MPFFAARFWIGCALPAFSLSLMALGAASLLRLDPAGRSKWWRIWCAPKKIRFALVLWAVVVPVSVALGLWLSLDGLLATSFAVAAPGGLLIESSVNRFIRHEAKRRQTERQHWLVRKPAEQRLAHQAALRQQELDRVQAASLRRLMDPHFLFNALNGIMHDMMFREWDRAMRHLKAFNRLAGQHISAGQEGWQSLEAEWMTLRDYIELEVRRMGRPIDWNLQPLPAGLGGRSIPAFLVQPLVENALWHGLGGTARSGDGRLSVFAVSDGAEHVAISVVNAPSSPTDGSTEPVRLAAEPAQRRHASDLIRQRLNLLDRSGKSGYSITHHPDETVAQLVVPCTLNP